MPSILIPVGTANAVPVHLVTPDAWAALLAGWQDTAPVAAAFAKAQGYVAKPGTLALLPGADGTLAAAVLGVDAAGTPGHDPFAAGHLPTVLPDGAYRFADAPADAFNAVLAFVLGTYRFDRYRKPTPRAVHLVCPEGVEAAEVIRVAEAVFMARDLVNTPTSDLGPAELEAAVRDLGARYGANVSAIVGEELLAQNFPMIHAVGRAAAAPPRLLDLTWGDEAAPKVTLVGKGVCFDTGGLDIKPPSSMLLMKKDMGGAAAALACARMVMDAGLKVRLRLLVPIVENAISGNAFRPGDILRSRKGLTVEIGNTDAEGRLILADALSLADEEAPDLLIDYATLTGAARVALGPDLPPLYTPDDRFAEAFQRIALAVNDPVWRMPLWSPYDRMLRSKIADVNHVSSGGFAGSITAALFLKRFVEKAGTYAHLDIFAWVPAGKPGRPEGAECQGARATYALLRERYGR